MKKILWAGISKPGEACHAAHVTASRNRSWALHTHDFHEIFWVDSGLGEHILRDHSHPLRHGMLVFVRAWDTHGFRPAPSSEPFAFINVAFPIRAWVDLVKRYDLGTIPLFDAQHPTPPLLELSGPMAASVGGAFRSLLSSPRGELWRDALLTQVAVVCGGKSADDGTREAPSWLRTALLAFTALDDWPRRTASDLATLAGCSGGHLSRTMQQALGISPTEWISSRRLERAAALLESTGFSVTDVALEAGFENLSHFHRSFFRKYQSTPLQFRKSRAKKIA